MTVLPYTDKIDEYLEFDDVIDYKNEKGVIKNLKIKQILKKLKNVIVKYMVNP